MPLIFLPCMLSVASDGAHGPVHTDNEFCTKFTVLNALFTL